MRWIAIAAAASAWCHAQAKIVTEEVRYKDGETECVGFLAYDDARNDRRPGIIIVHEWWGLNDYPKMRAKQLAELGFVALAVDIYGGGKNTTDRQEAGRWAKAMYENPDALRARAKAGYEALAAHKRVDKEQIAAIGYCFGGSTVLQMAYSGLPLAGVVSFHGSPVPPRPEDQGKIKARLLVLHGADDPMISADEIARFQEGVRKAGADWQMVSYGGAVHAFTNHAVDQANISGARYNRAADERSWRHMQIFFNELFGTPIGPPRQGDE